jgi:hypothetical protein
MPFTFLYAIAALLGLLAVFLVTYRLRGLKWALGLTIAVFIITSVCYIAFVAIATSQM